MKKIPSFTIDHLRLQRGIYVSRKDYVGDEVITTFDIRMKNPNREPALGQVGLMLETFRFIADYKGEIPGATAKDCGNYLLQDLPMARWEANKYLTEVLEVITDEQLVYPQ